MLYVLGQSEEGETMSAGTQAVRPNVVFGDGFLSVDGVKIPLPKRPAGEVVGTVYDVLSLVGVVASIALVIAQLIRMIRV